MSLPCTTPTAHCFPKARHQASPSKQRAANNLLPTYLDALDLGGIKVAAVPRRGRQQQLAHLQGRQNGRQQC